MFTGAHPQTPRSPAGSATEGASLGTKTGQNVPDRQPEALIGNKKPAFCSRLTAADSKWAQEKPGNAARLFFIELGHPGVKCYCNL